MMIVEPIAKAAASLLKKRFTVQYPEERESIPDNYRGKLRLDKDTCINCSACALICPNKTIDMVIVETDRGQKKMPQVNHARCLFCGLCEEVCPPKCLTLTKNYEFETYDRRELVTRPEELE
jgi:NADH-quinone oxidoreductase chain I